MGLREDLRGRNFLDTPFGHSVLRFRRVFIVSSQIFLIVFGYFLAFSLRFDAAESDYAGRLFWRSAPWIILIKIAVFYYFDLYRGWWRYVGMDDLADIIRASTVSTLAFIVVAVFFFPGFPRSIFVIDWFITITFIGGIRFALRAFREKLLNERTPMGSNVLIYGSRQIGVELLKEIRNNEALRLNVIGFIDDFAPKKGFKIHGVSILGGREEIPRILERHKVDEIIITSPSLKPKELKDLISRFRETNVRFKIVPPMADILNERVSVKQLREVSVEDLLGRKTLGWATRTTREVLESLTRNQRLIAVLTGQFGDFGLPPSRSSFLVHAMVANHYLDGGYYPVGGSGVFVDAIAPVIKAAAGRLLINAEVAGIVVEGDSAVGVRMARDGAVIRAPVVISDAGVINTFGRLLPHDVARRHRLEKALAAVRPSVAHLCLYVGFRESARALRLPRHNIWVYRDEDHDRGFAAAGGEPDAARVPVFISFPSAKDPDFERRHPGRATVDVVALAPYAWFERWQDTHWKDRGEEYEAFKNELAQQMLERLYEQLPQLRGKVDRYELSTPLTTRHFCNYAQGEIYGIAHSPERFRQRFLRPATPIRGLYLTGQDIVSCGVGGALMAGVLTASAILRRNLLPAIRQSAPRPAKDERKADAALSATGRARA